MIVHDTATSPVSVPQRLYENWCHSEACSNIFKEKENPQILE